MTFFALAATAAVVFAVTDSPVVQLTAELGVYVASTALLAVAWWRERRRSGGRDPLVGLAFVSLLVYTAATVAFAGLPVALGVTLPAPSVVDAMYLIAYGLFAALLWRLGSRSRAESRQQYLDTVTVALGVLPVIGVRLIEPQLAHGAVTAGDLVYLANPVAVAALLALTIRLAFRAHQSTMPYLLLGGWIAFEIAADLVLLDAAVAGTYTYGQPWQSLWVLSAGCVGALVLHPGARAMLQPQCSPPVRGRTRLFVMGLALTGPMIADSMGERADRLIMIIGVLLIVVVCLRLSGLLVDIAAQRRSQQELRRLSETLSHQSLHDALTGLGNRTLLNARLAEGLAGGITTPTSVLLLDLDDFKLVNDSLGHAAGDLLLIEAARRLERELRIDDLAGRLGGDEFVVILDSTDAARATALAERLLVTLAQPMRLAETEVSVTVSIGIATSDDVQNGLSMLGAADMAMYQAKQRGKAAVAVFDPSMHTMAEERLTLEIDLRRTLRDEDLFLAYQPIVDLRTGSLTGVEALVRWNDATRGAVSPEVFIPIAERSGLIHPLGAWVLQESVAQLHRWDQEAPHSALTLNVNISTRQLERPGLLRVLDELIADGLDPSRLVLEITETALTVDGEAADRTLRELRARGVRLAVDDFGTGYSSLSRLQAAPVSQLKMDRSFVDEIVSATSPAPIIQATVAMAVGLGLSVIAEGVETVAQLQYLRRLGCAHAQGYLLARPTDARAISGLLDGPLPWAALLDVTPQQQDRRRPQLRRRLDPAAADSAARGGVQRELQPSEVIREAEAIAAGAAAEVAADAACTARAAVVAACTAALQAAEKAERVAAEAAAAAVGAAARLAGSGRDPREAMLPTTSASTPVPHGPAVVGTAAPAPWAARTAEAAASAVLKVAEDVQACAVAAAAASVTAAGLIERQLAEQAATTASAVTAHGPAAAPRPEPPL